MSLDFDRDVLPVAFEKAHYCFGDDPEKSSDVLSVAWELFQEAPPEATAWSIVDFAARRVAVGRHLSYSERGLYFNPRKVQKVGVQSLHYLPFRVLEGDAFFREGDNPADRVAFRIDFADFLRSLSLRELAILVALASGERTLDVAKRFGLTPGRISQYRVLFRDRWERFIGDQ